jgi:arylsulfatase A
MLISALAVRWMLLLFMLFLTVLSPSSLPAAEAGRPNVIVIMADDLGYGDVSCYGATSLKTPNIDRLSKEGLRFTNGYCSASTCTPTRFSFLTGKYAFRQQGTGIAPPNATALIQPGTVTIASILNDAGYKTAVVGKWHLGLGAKPQPDWNGELKPGPLEIGFDYCFLLPTTNDRVPSVYVENHRVRDLDPADPLWVGRKNPDGQPTGITHRSSLKMDWSHGHNHTIHNGIGRIGYFTGGHKARWRDEDLADEWVKQSVKWIEANRDEPFFLFFSSHDIHVPRMPHERFQGKTKLGFRGDAIVQLDWCVGQLLETLDRLKLTDNTLIVFCSDNGPVLDDGYQDGAVTQLGDHTPAGPYRGGKYTIYEGGTRTPFITRWPGRIKPGVSDKIISTIDLAACMAALTEQSLAPDACPDSFNLLPALLGDAKATGRDHVVEQGRGLALRVGDWKLLQHPTKRVNRKRVNAENRTSNVELFNLVDDPAEEKNLANEFPKRAKAMQAQLKAIQESGRSRS